MKAIMCDACNNVIKEKDVQYFNLGFGRAELCKECKEKANKIKEDYDKKEQSLNEEYEAMRSEYMKKLKEIGIDIEN